MGLPYQKTTKCPQPSSGHSPGANLKLPNTRHSVFRVLLGVLPVLLLGALLAGCETLSYYGQSVGGQLEVLAKRKPIVDVIADEAVPENVRKRLSAVLRMREFAVDELGLPENKSYSSYADLGRPHVVWNVFAAPEFSVKPVTWCFPIVGCVVYRGYFKEKAARDYADKLQADGIDTFVAGINAYSTLGWFNDPVLNTFLNYPQPRLAGLIFHEITHQKIYIKDDSVFNESLATAVELEGVRRWLEANESEEDSQMIRRQLSRSDDVTLLLLKTRDRLADIYGGGESDDAKRKAKADTFVEMKADYEKLKQSWDGYDGYDRWFSQDFNNGYLVSAAAYRSRLPAFESLMKKLGGDMDAFWLEAQRLSELSPTERERALDKLMP